MSLSNMTNQEIRDHIVKLKASGAAAAEVAKVLLDTRTDPTESQKAAVAKGLTDVAEASELSTELLRRADRERSSAEVKEALEAVGFDLGLDRPGSRKISVQAADEVRGFRAKAGASWARKTADKFQRIMSSPDGAKALTSGSIDVPSIIQEPVQILGRPTSILDLVPKPKNTEKGNGNAFSYLRQTARTNNAAAVADNATKPTSVYSFGDVEDTFRVYAHLSEKFPRRYLDDYNGLIQILQDQMGAGLMEALEEDILTGAVQPSTGFTGVLNTSGIQTQAFATDVLTTLSTARYKLINSSQHPNAWVLNPTDVQVLELMRENGATGPLMFRNGIADIEKFLGEHPIVMSTLIPAGTALLGDWDTTSLIVREDDHLDVDTSGEKFEKNQVQFRLEGRYGFTVGRPLSFVKATLSAG